ncbi:NUDIX hydrolase [Alkalihalobacillus sp. AL-G]|nr:NUDIX hydrolase [Alkalihalobacillus sp. AL-G]
MVKQHIKTGDVVWNFPGGGVEKNESPEEACIREVKEETGYNIEIDQMINRFKGKITYLATIIDGRLDVDLNIEGNEDILEAKWIDLSEKGKFSTHARYIIRCLLNQEDSSS